MPKKETGFRGTSLKSGLVADIERFIADHPEAGYKSVSDFVQEAVRVRMQEVKKLLPIFPRFEILNADENGTKVIDRELHAIAQIYLKPESIWCDVCERHDCVHIRYALNDTEIQKIIRKRRREGWKLPEV